MTTTKTHPNPCAPVFLAVERVRGVSVGGHEIEAGSAAAANRALAVTGRRGGPVAPGGNGEDRPSNAQPYMGRRVRIGLPPGGTSGQPPKAGGGGEPAGSRMGTGKPIKVTGYGSLDP